MTVIASICARGGSKGVPHKNVRVLGGKPLIVHTIEQALTCPEIDRVFVSTDSDEIAAIARRTGAEVPFVRPSELATDDASKIAVIRHLVDQVASSGVDIRLIVDLDPTSPLRLVADISACIAKMEQRTDCVITGFLSDKNPYFNMVEEGADGFVRLSKQPTTPVLARQHAPAVYSMNASVYVFRPELLVRGLWGGHCRLHVMPRERSIDIDSELDFAIVERLWAARNGV